MVLSNDGSATAHLYRPKIATVLMEGYSAESLRRDVVAALSPHRQLETNRPRRAQPSGPRMGNVYSRLVMGKCPLWPEEVAPNNGKSSEWE